MKDRVNILGYNVSRVDMNETIATMERFIASGKFHYMVVGNFACLVQARQDQELMEIAKSSDLTIADGYPIVWASRLYGEPIGSRVAGPDLFELFSKTAEKRGYTFYLLGGEPGDPEKVALGLNNRYPELKILGTYSPNFGPISEEENQKIVGLVNEFSPDVLWIGMSAPKQEKWIWRNRSSLNTRIAIGVGAAFDFQIGKQKRAPRWMQNWGLEWLYRPTQDPSLLWRKRYDRWFTQGVIPIFLEALQLKIKTKNNR